MYRKHYNNNRSFSRQKRTIKTVDVSFLVKKVSETAVFQSHEQPIKHQFSDFQIADSLKQAIQEKGYTTPSPIQDVVIPVALTGKDVVGIANTGTGKTAAFLLPLINKILSDRSQKVLIVAPTRELAVQIQDEFRSFTRHMQLSSVLCIGGVGMFKQIQGLRQNPHVVIGTPGRLKDLKNQGKLSIALFQNIVLDEVDRMLDMGFVHDVKFLISHLPKFRQSLFFSATLSPEIKQIIQSISENPIVLSVKQQETASNVDQDIIRTNGRQKLDVLHDVLIDKTVEKAIIFGRTKWGIEKLSRQLADRGFSVVALHGNKNQNQRQRALEQFKKNQVAILLATDIASRGIDVDNVTHVINFDLPETYEDYVHRIGRTGRNNKKGIALSFVE